MDFFEQLGKKISDAGQGVAQSTKNFTEITRLNGVISDKEKQIAKLISDLGQSYYDRCCQDPSAPNFEIMSTITNLKAEIAQTQENIKQIKGITKCENCGAEVAITAAFCPSCGAPVKQAAPAAEPAAAPAVRTCPNCHAEVSADNVFCNFCGTKLD